MGTYQKGSFLGGSNIYLNFIICDNCIVISSIIPSYILNWYHTYLLHLGMDRTEAMIHQHLYWPGIINAVQKEVTNCDIFQRTKHQNKKYDELPAKESE